MNFKPCLALIPTCLAMAILSPGCANQEVGQGEQAVTEQQSLTVSLTILESKLVYDSKPVAFTVKGSDGLVLPCRDRSFFLTSKPSLYDDGWSPESADVFSEQVEGAAFQEYILASCRDESTEVLGWFTKTREYEFLVSEQLLDEDYRPAELPLALRLSGIGSDEPQYFSCDGSYTKTLIGETENSKKFEIGAQCKRASAPSKAALGPIDFITNPGPYAAVASYNAWMLPAVTSTKPSFEMVREALLKKVPEGTYHGAMSTLSKLCSLEIQQTADGLIVNHTILSSNHTRHLELKADALLGFVEGDLYKDLLRVESAPIGTFAAAEFRDSKGESFVLRFEDASVDKRTVRINGSEAYCRRLVP